MKDVVVLVVMDIVVIAAMFAMYHLGRLDGRAEGREEVMARLDRKI